MTLPGTGNVGDGLVESVPDDRAPHIDEFGVLRFHGGWLALSPTQEAVMRPLIAHFGKPVARADVAAATWPDGGPDHHAIDVHIHRIRPRLKDVGLVIHALRGRGFMLETAGG
jgi:DNA-binding response OmpR family regulator